MRLRFLGWMGVRFRSYSFSSTLLWQAFEITGLDIKYGQKIIKQLVVFSKLSDLTYTHLSNKSF